MQLRKESLKIRLAGIRTLTSVIPVIPVTSARALHWYRRGQGSNPGKPDFQAFFSQLHKLR